MTAKVILNPYSNRWTRAEIAGAVSFTPAHSAGIITSNQFPADLVGNQAAWMSGVAYLLAFVTGSR